MGCWWSLVRIQSPRRGRPQCVRVSKKSAPDYHTGAPKFNINVGGAGEHSQIMKVELKTNGRRWYCEYYTTSLNGVQERHRDYGYVNKIADKAERMQALLLLKAKILREQSDQPGIGTIAGRVLFILQQKKLYQKPKSYASSKTACKSFIEFLTQHSYQLLPPDQVTLTHIQEFIDWTLQRGCSNRTVNDYLVDISAIFNRMVDEEIIYKNPCNKIRKLPTQSESNQSFTEDELEAIKQWVKENDPYLGLFLKFIAYPFLRISEVRFLKVKHFDLKNGFINTAAFSQKTGINQKKKILRVFNKTIESMDLKNCDREHYIFTTDGTPGPVMVGKNHFTRRFKRMKDELGFSRHHTMYAVRHTMISNLIANGAPHWEVMKLTGHRTLEAFEKYLRSIRAGEMKDLSDVFSVAI